MDDDEVYEALDALAGYELRWSILKSRSTDLTWTLVKRPCWYLVLALESESDRMRKAAAGRLYMQDAGILKVEKHWTRPGAGGEEALMLQLLVAADCEKDALRQVEKILGDRPPYLLSPNR